MTTQFEIEFERTASLRGTRSRQRRELKKQFTFGQRVKIIASPQTAIVLEDPALCPLSEFIQVQIDGQSKPKFFCVDEIQHEASTVANPADQPDSRKATRQRRTQTAALKRGADPSFSAVVDPADAGNDHAQRRHLLPTTPLVSDYEYTDYPEPIQVAFRHINTDRTGWAIAFNQKGMIRINFEAADGVHQSDIPEKFVVWKPDDTKPLEPCPQIEQGDWVAMVRDAEGNEIAIAQQRRGQVTRVYKQQAEVRFRGELRSSELAPLSCFARCQLQTALSYPVKPLQAGYLDTPDIPFTGSQVVVTAPEHPLYGESFTVACSSIYAVFRADGLGFAYEELGYRITPPELDRRATLLKRLDRIRKSGFVAPTGSWLEPAPKKKKLKNGDIKTYPYWRVRANDPIFQKNTQFISHLYLGTDADPAYKDWCKRMKRRRLIAQIEREIDKLEQSSSKKVTAKRNANTN